MTALSEELTWRGFVNQTTYKDLKSLDGDPITFYWGVDPSADSMQVGNFAMAMMVRHFIDHGHKAILLVGGATGMIGDPDGKKQERDLISLEEIQHNKDAIAAQYRQVFAGKEFTMVNNYDWFKDLGYLNFLREIGKHVPMRQMLGREFVQSRLSDDGEGISYAEFSYSLIQGYDFLHLSREKGATLQVAGADQWGNSIAGVELIRRIDGKEAHVWTGPLIVNKATGVKFGKTEGGAIWLDPAKTTPTQFYQFWINCDDAGVEDYLKIYTLLSREKIDVLMGEHRESPGLRKAQFRLAEEVTKLVHGEEGLQIAKKVTDYIRGSEDLDAATQVEINALKKEIPTNAEPYDGSVLIVQALVDTGLASSKTEAIRFVKEGAIKVNNKGIDADTESLHKPDGGRHLLIRRGSAYKNSALVEFE